jgi:hypothetical protein
MDSAKRFADLLDAKIPSAKLEMDVDGRVRVLFTAEELTKVNSFLKEELDRTYTDYTPLWDQAVTNIETYKAVKIDIPDGGGKSVYPAPIARIPADQIIASTFNSMMRARPIFSIDAYLSKQYPVPQAPVAPPPTLPGMAPVPPPPLEIETVSADDIARAFERGYDFIARERVQFPKKALRSIGGAVKGCPYWWKVVARPDVKTKLAPKVDGAILDFEDKYEYTRNRGDLIQHDLIPYWNGMKPLDQDEIATADWFGERIPMRGNELLRKWNDDELFLVADDAEATLLAQALTELYDPFKARVAAAEKKTTQSPTMRADVWLTWFYWDVSYIDPTDKKKHLKRLNCLGDFHRTNGKLMNCFLNQYEHQERPYELIDQIEETDSTVERMVFHQTMFTYMAHAEVKSAFHANNMSYGYDPDNPAMAAYFGGKRKIGMGENIPGIPEKDFAVFRAGDGHYSLLGHLKFFLDMSQLDSKQSKLATGADLPGRTPSSTMEQVLSRAEQEPILFLARLSQKFSRIVRLDLETRRQFQPLGEVLPMWDEKEKSTIELPFRFPVGDVMDNFRIALTAADEELRKEHDPEQLMMKKNAVMQDGEYVVKAIVPLIDMQRPITPATTDLIVKIITRDQELLRRLVEMTDTDADNFDLTKEIRAIVAEHNQMIAQQQLAAQQAAQAAQQQQMMGVQNAPSQAAGAGSPLPGNQGGQPAGSPPAVGGQPAIPPPPIPPPAQGGGVGPAETVQ